MAGQYFLLPQLGSNSNVTSVNSITGAVDIIAGSGITVTPSGQNITIAATGGTSPTSNYFNGYLQLSGANNWAAADANFGDPSASGGSSSLTTRVSNGLTVTAAASNVAGITWTPNSSSAVYLIMLSTAIILGSPTNFGLRLYDGTVEIGASSGWSAGNGPVAFAGIYAPGTASPVTVRVQVFSDGTTLTVLGDSVDEASWRGINFQIVQLK